LYVEGVVRLLESEEKLNQARTQAKRSNG
jgi:hypothetical protein